MPTGPGQVEVVCHPQQFPAAVGRCSARWGLVSHQAPPRRWGANLAARREGAVSAAANGGYSDLACADPRGDDPDAQFEVQAAGGTALRAWSNGGAGVPVVISNGLGTPPTAWRR